MEDENNIEEIEETCLMCDKTTNGTALCEDCYQEFMNSYG